MFLFIISLPAFRNKIDSSLFSSTYLQSVIETSLASVSIRSFINKIRICHRKVENYSVIHCESIEMNVLVILGSKGVKSKKIVIDQY